MKNTTEADDIDAIVTKCKILILQRIIECIQKNEYANAKILADIYQLFMW